MALTCRHLDYVPWLAQVVVRRTLLIYFIISAIFLAILILVVFIVRYGLVEVAQPFLIRR